MVWKTFESQGKVSEKSGNFENNIEWHPASVLLFNYFGISQFTVKTAQTLTGKQATRSVIEVSTKPIFNLYFGEIPMK